MTVKVHPEVPLALGFLHFSGAPSEAHWQAIAAYNAITSDWTNSRAFATTLYNNVSFSITPLAVVNKTETELRVMILPLLDSLNDLNIQYNFSIRSGLRYLDASWILAETFSTVGDVLIGSRMLPRSLLANESGVASALGALKEIVEAGLSVSDFALELPTRRDRDIRNAVLPAWREMQRHVLTTL